ncbi:MAG: 16S rRNA (guanine(527)-N(7))-methyltransferase RsmG [Flavobacteriales bacterium]|jgi:16S rRNA (guanine527-N7)-methyltransferase|nr:16S rRNA (guanine(527)-N(7))-methyltransferase RsmG [Flavobacteriales bacterium]
MQGLELILKYFPDLTDHQKQQFSQLESLYAEWNDQINVISRKDIDQLYKRHVLHSLGLAKVIQFIDGTSLLDVGTGGGFPGIPLAILFPKCRFHCVDSIGKKIKVVNEVAEAIGLINLTAEHQRAEKVKDKYDFVISRAVTRMKPFINWVHGKTLKKNSNKLLNGILYLKGGDIIDELAEIKRDYNVFNLSDHFTEEFFETKKVVWVKL